MQLRMAFVSFVADSYLYLTSENERSAARCWSKLAGLEQVCVVALGDIGVGAQPALEVILAYFAEQRVERVAGRATRACGKLWRELKQRYGRVEPGAKKEGDR
jgi:hypothetical protein